MKKYFKINLVATLIWFRKQETKDQVGEATTSRYKMGTRLTRQLLKLVISTKAKMGKSMKEGAEKTSCQIK
jgi:hypothetical protein